MIKNDLRDVSNKEKSLIKKWAGSHRFPDYSNTYNKKVLVKENNDEYWILIPDSLIDNIPFQNKTIIYLYYLGAISEGTIFCAVGFYNNTQ